MSDFAHSHLHWVSLGDIPPLRVPRRVAGLLRRAIAPELVLYQWLHDHLAGPSAPTEDQSRVVAYLHGEGASRRELESLWWEGLRNWFGKPGALSRSVVWQQRDCTGADGQPGRDFATCEEEGAGDETVIRFYPAGADLGSNLPLKPMHTGAQLADAVERLGRLDLSERLAAPGVAPQQNDHGNEFVEYYAAACPHCKHMEKDWAQAAADWQTLAQRSRVPSVTWKTKECLDKDWHPGRDYADCVAAHVRSFPTMRYRRADVEAEPSRFMDYKGRRSAKDLVDFVRMESGVGLDSASLGASPPTAGAAQPAPADTNGAAVPADAHGGTASATAAGPPDASSASSADASKAEEEAHDPMLEEATLSSELAHEGYDYRLVHYYAAAGPRSRRLGALMNNAMRRWTRTVDPDDDAMFLANLKKHDLAQGFDLGPEMSFKNSDPPFVAWEQRECFDEHWKPGADAALCRLHNVKVPSVHLYKVSATGEPQPGLEYRGARTQNGILDFLRHRTDLDTRMRNKERVERYILGLPEEASETPLDADEPRQEPATFAERIAVAEKELATAASGALGTAEGQLRAALTAAGAGARKAAAAAVGAVGDVAGATAAKVHQVTASGGESAAKGTDEPRGLLPTAGATAESSMPVPLVVGAFAGKSLAVAQQQRQRAATRRTCHGARSMRPGSAVASANFL
eukprot:TRINITY_DN26238_c0_g2_i1.p1 TRINITY_DN26238_c0_g2~~TRINITY_DN26238_c0_g2_i1.p1  ORF type:complete len:727 (-),score=160.50 TRINITY_DN26238_c0_g2_i1:30-2093(-)